MIDQSRRYGQMNSKDTPNVISSQGLADGPTPCSSLDGPQTEMFGQEVAVASRLAVRARKEAPQMSVICGRYGLTLFERAVPMSLWENRLLRRLGMVGSTECLMTWKVRDTPAKRQLF